MHLCVELDVRAHGVHDDLLRDGALIADPEGKADDAPEPTGGNYADRLQHVLHRLPVLAILPLGCDVQSSTTPTSANPIMTDTLSADGNPSHPKHPNTEGRHQT